MFSIPKTDVVLVDIKQISAEYLAIYISNNFLEEFKLNYADDISNSEIFQLKVKVFEDLNKCASYTAKIN